MHGLKLVCQHESKILKGNRVLSTPVSHISLHEGTLEVPQDRYMRAEVLAYLNAFNIQLLGLQRGLLTDHFPCAKMLKMTKSFVMKTENKMC